MEIVTMGKVVVHAKIENLEDLYRVESGEKQSEVVRTVEVDDALVDTGAMMLSLPKRYCEQLGLRYVRSRKSKTVGGIVEIRVLGTVRLTVEGRDFTTDVAEIPDECPVLIGQIPLEGLDFVVDPVNQRLMGNPDHGGEHMIDLFSSEPL